MKKLILFFITASASVLFSQESGDKPNILTVFMSGASSKIVNENYTKDHYNSVRYPICFNQGISYTKYFNDHIGLTIGAEFSNYKNNISCKNYAQSTTTVKGPDGSDYYPITIADYTQNRKVNMVEVPVLLRLETGAKTSGIKAFADVGIKICAEFSSKLESNGTITNQGIWATGNPYFWTFSQNNSYYDFKTITIASTNDYHYKERSLALFVNAGFYVPLRERLNFSCSFYYTKGFDDINLSEKNIPYRNFLGEESAYEPSKISSLGLRFGLSFPLGKA